MSCDVTGFVPLDPVETNTSWDGDTKSAGTYTIDLANDFNLPAGVKAVHVRLLGRWSSVGQYYAVSARIPGGTDIVTVRPQEANQWSEQAGIVNCDENGDIEIKVFNTSAEVHLIVTGYFV